MKKIATLLLCLHSFLFMRAQQNLGIRNSNYAGIQGALLNPSSIADSKLKWDINIFSIGAVFDNNFLYIKKGTIPFFGFKSIIEGIKHRDKYYTNFDPANPDKRYNFTLSNEILGPSFSARIAKKHEIGFTLVSRSYANINNFPGHTAQNAFDFLENKGLWNTDFNDNTTKMNGMSWLEYGLHYATTLYKKGNRELTAGISIKYLLGLGAAYVKNTNLNYNLVDTSQFLFSHSSLDYGRSDYDSYKHANGFNDLIHGHGFSGDIGFTYILLKETTDMPNGPENKKWIGPKTNYEYKLGISFIDIGSINFNKMSSAYHLQADNANFLDWHKNNFTSNIQIDQTLSSVFYQGDSAKSLSANHFKMGLPAAISLQADWNFYKNFFANATFVKGFGHGNRQGVIRPDVYSVTARYETKWFEASIPISLLYYGSWRPRVGLAVRAGYFFFGGDALGGLAGLHNMQGADFYAGIHYFVTK